MVMEKLVLEEVRGCVRVRMDVHDLTNQINEAVLHK